VASLTERQGMLDYDTVFVNVAAFDTLVAGGWAIVEPDPIPPRETAVAAKMSKPYWEEALPLTLSGHASAAYCLSICLTGLRQRLDQHDGPGVLLRCGHSGSAHHHIGGGS
jgi:hypothetical protein